MNNIINTVIVILLMLAVLIWLLETMTIVLFWLIGDRPITNGQYLTAVWMTTSVAAILAILLT